MSNEKQGWKHLWNLRSWQAMRFDKKIVKIDWSIRKLSKFEVLKMHLWEPSSWIFNEALGRHKALIIYAKPKWLVGATWYYSANSQATEQICLQFQVCIYNHIVCWVNRENVFLYVLFCFFSLSKRDGSHREDHRPGLQMSSHQAERYVSTFQYPNTSPVFS